MADFLTRISERTLGVAAVAHPIIAPLFAPTPASIRDETGVALPVENGALTQPATSPSTSFSTDGLPWLEAPELRTEQERELPLVPQSAAPRFNQPTILAEPEPSAARAKVQETPEQHQMSWQNTGRRTENDVPSDLSRLEPLTRPSAEGEPETLLVPRQASPAPLRNQAALIFSSTLTPAQPPSVSVIGQPAPGAALEGHQGEVVPPAVVSASPAQQAAPVVHVTIGRIEVRAILPPTRRSPPPTQRPTSTLSLEAFLQQRNGGKP